MADLSKCRSCNKNFSAFPSGAADHFPLILRCGHTFCKRCITKWATGKKKVITCAICQVETKCQNGKESVLNLWPNVYMAGVMVCGSELPSLSDYFANSDRVASIKKPNDKKRLWHKCSECVSVPASCRCVQCLADMCEKCFISVHSHSRLLQQHQSVPLRTSLINTECEKHHRVLEFFCEDDKIPICPECMIGPEHRSHNIVQTVKKYDGLQQELKNAQSEACCALQYCTRVKSQLEDEIHKIRNAAYQQAQRSHQRILDYIGSIQSHLLGLTKELRHSAEHCCGELISMLEEIETKEILIREACEVADLVISSETKSQVMLNPDTLLETLQMANTLPYNLVARKESIFNNNNDEFKDVTMVDGFEFSFSLGPGLPAFIHQLGEIEIKGEMEYQLVPISMNPELLVAAPAKKASDDVEKKLATVRQIQEPPAKSQELVHVTFMESPSNFRVQRWADKFHIEAIERCLKSFKTRKPMVDDIITTVTIGELCAAFYKPSRTWYRALVVRKIRDENLKSEDGEQEAHLDTDCTNVEAAESRDMVEVIYIDYGNTEIIPVSCLRRLPEDLKTVPELSIPCQLGNVCPGNDQSGWPSHTVDYFSKVITNRPLLMTTTKREKGCRIVDLHRPAADEIDADVPMSIRDALVFLGLAKFQVSVPPSCQAQAAVKKFLTPSPLPAHSLVRVTVSYMHNPDRFLVQQTDSNIKYLDQLMEKIQIWTAKQLTGKDAPAFKEGIHYLQIICPKEGMICLAKYPYDEQWYRAKIIGINDDRTVKVEYVDFGDTATVNFVQLLKIPETFTRLPVQALPCELYGVSLLPGEEIFSPICRRRFGELCANSELIMEVRAVNDGRYQVDLFDSMDEDPSQVSITDRLYREGLVRVEKREKKSAMSTGNVTAGEPKDQETDTGIEKPPSEPEEKPSDSNVKARVTLVSSPDLFYVQTEAQMCELNKLMLEVQQSIEEKSEEWCQTESDAWTEGAFCVVKSKMEKRWCRAKIETLDIEGQTCKVVLMDYGWLEHLPLAYLLKLPEKYSGPAEFLTRCTLGSVTPAGGSGKWTLGAVDRFQELVGGEECLMEISSDEAGCTGPLPVDIWINESGHDGARLTTANCVKISRILTMDGLALPARKPRVKCNVTRYASALSETASGSLSDMFAQCSTPHANSVCNPDDQYEDAEIVNEEMTSKRSPSPVQTEESEITYTKMVEPSLLENRFNKDEAIGILSDEIPASNPLSYKYFNRLQPGEWIPCCITHIHDHKTVYLKLRVIDCGIDPNPVLDELYQWKLMMEQVQDVERSYLALLQEDDLVVGRPCLCQDTGDGGDDQWHRAIILSVQPLPEAVLVQYVDFGTLEQVSLDRVRQIPKAVCEIPVQAYPCLLADVLKVPEHCSREGLLTEMKERFEGKDLVAEVQEISESPPEKSHFKAMYKIVLYHVDEDGDTRNVLK